MKTKLIRETDIVREACTYLQERNYFFWRYNNIAAPGRGFPKYALRGLPDICGIWNGIFFGIEVKRASSNEREPNGRTVRGGMLSQMQAEVGYKIVLNGGEYVVIHSLAELEIFMSGLATKYSKEMPKKMYGPLN